MRNSKLKTRIDYFDVLRGIGIVYMVLGHIYLGEVFDKYIHAFHMPIFFFVSGYFYNGDKYKAAKNYLLHEMRTLMVPYTFFVIICQVLHYIYTKEFSVSYFLLSYISSNNNRIDVAGAYWFLLCLFVVKLIYFVLTKYIKNPYVQTTIVVCITLYGNFTERELLFCLESAMSCLAFIHIGYLMKKNWVKVSCLFSIPMRGIVILFIINISLIFINGDVNIRTNRYSNVFLFWINSITAIICYTNLAKRIENSAIVIIGKIAKGLKYIGKNSMAFLVVNEITIYGVRQMIEWVHIYNGNEMGIGYSCFVNILVFLLTMIVICIFNEVVCCTKMRVILGR